jgi:hypothetical protein
MASIKTYIPLGPLWVADPIPPYSITQPDAGTSKPSTVHEQQTSPSSEAVFDQLERVTRRAEDLESFLTFASNVHPEMVTEYTAWLKTKKAMGVK